MTAHDHPSYVEGCFRCELSRGEVGARPAVDVAAELADLARLIDRADAEASRLRQRRLRAWTDAHAAGLSWRAIAAASGGMDHAQIAKTVNAIAKGTD